MTAQPTGTPAALVHNLRYNKMLHAARCRADRFHRSGATRDTWTNGSRCSPWATTSTTRAIRYGFMEDPDVPEVLVYLRQLGVPIDPDDVTFFLGRETIVVGRRKGMATWREKLFVLMARNAVRATAFFKLPPERVVELGVQVEM